MSDLPRTSVVREQLGTYLRSFLALGRGRLALVLTLVALGTLVEGIGILLLIPLVGLIFTKFAVTGSDNAATALLHGFLQPLSSNVQLALLLGAFLILLLIRALISWQRDIQSMRLSYDVVEYWRGQIVDAVVGANWRQLQEMQNSRLEFAAASEVGRLAMGSDLLLRGIVSTVQFVLLIGLAFYLSPSLTALVLICVLAGTPLLLPLIKASHRHGEQLSQDGSKRQNVFSELLAGMKLAKVHDAEQRFADEFKLVSNAMRQRALAFASTQMRLHNAFQFAGGVAAAVIVYIGLIWLHTTPALLTSLLVLMTRIIGPVQQLAQSAQSLLTMLPAIGQLNEIKAALGAGAGSIDSSISQPVEHSAHNGPMAVEMTAVNYQPPGHNGMLLQNVSCNISAGELCVLLGPSGSGKTTIADLLLGLIPADNGSVEIGGYSMSDPEQRAAARREIAYVPQDPFLFDQTLRQNLLWAEPDASEEELHEALGLAEALDFVGWLPAGLDSQVGNRGSRLSGGERQRICLARALLRNPGLLILDEATSALDPAVEEKLLQTLNQLRGRVTLLLIAHRLPDWFVPDRCFVVENGTLQARSPVSDGS